MKSQWTVLVGYLTISANLLAVMKRFVDNNIICLSGFSNTATQLMHAPVHGVRNTVQQLLRKTQSFLLSYVPPNRPELNSINYEIYGVYASVNMSFNKVDEIRQRLVELWKSRNTTFQ